MPNNYINYIKKDIDGTITDIYLLDSRLAELSTQDLNKAITVYNAGTEESPDPLFKYTTLHYIPTDAQGKLNKDLDAAGYKLLNIGLAVDDTDAVNYGQLKDCIAALGHVFNLKGMKETPADLPQTGNKLGDVWYVKSTKSGWVWINEGPAEAPVYRWEEFGPVIDLSGYLQIANLAKTTGQAENTAMTQKATTNAIQAVSDIANAAIPAPENPSNNNILIYNSEQQRWIAGSISTGVLSVTNDDTAIKVVNTDPANPKVGLNVSEATNNIVEIKDDGIYVPSSAAQAQADWTETDPTKASYIKNKPTLGTASSADVLVGNIEEFVLSNNLTSAKQVVDYVKQHNIYQGPTEPTDTSIYFWYDTVQEQLKYRKVTSQEPYTYVWVVIGGGGGGGAVSGVKGNKETSYRTGNVNLTSANIGSIEDPETKNDADYLMYDNTNQQWIANPIDVGDVVGHTLVIKTARADIVESEHTLYLG